MTIKERFSSLLVHHEVVPAVRKRLVYVSIFAALAMGFCVYLIYLHFEPSQESFCNIAKGFNCDIVNKSMWSYLQFGPLKVPVSVLGFFTYLVLFLCAFGLLKDWKFHKLISFLKPKMIVFLMVLLSAVGIGFSLYLTYIEAFVLFNFCIFCVGQQILIILIFGFLLSAIGKLEKVI
jgi:uncharacterized membrane protein